jgi:hypothetical protein
MVDQNLKEDHSLAEEVKQIQKSMDKGNESLKTIAIDSYFGCKSL